MEAGKTGRAARLLCGDRCGGGARAEIGSSTRSGDYGAELGMAFQLVDDILGINRRPGVTGKSSSSDVRAGKRSAPVVAALPSGNDAGRRLASLLGGRSARL